MEHVFRRVQKIVFHPSSSQNEVASFHFCNCYASQYFAEAIAAIFDPETPFRTKIADNGGQQGVYRSIIVFRHPCTHLELDACRAILLALANIYGWQVEEVG